MKDEKLHGWWGLSYASFLTMPRVLMQEMPIEWQRKMADLLEEYDDAFDTSDVVCGTKVMAIDKNNKFAKMPDEIINYRRPNFEFINGIRINKTKTNGKSNLEK